MQQKAIFYHAGCSVCVSAEKNLAAALDPKKYQVDSVHLGTQKSRLNEAREAGVKSVPALVVDGSVFHINFGAALSDLT